MPPYGVAFRPRGCSVFARSSSRRVRIGQARWRCGRTPSGRATPLVLLAAAAALGGCSVVEEHPVIWLGLALFGVLGIILVVEVFDGLRLRWRRWRGKDPPPLPFQPGDTVHKLRPESSELRRRHLRRWRVVRRAFGAGFTEADPESERDSYD